MFPRQAKRLQRGFDEAGFEAPCGSLLFSARIRLDVLGMLLRRSDTVGRSFSRTLSFDASPQGGLELFAGTEFVVVFDEKGDVFSGDHHSLPFSGMGHGHTGVIDKTMCLIHKVGLEVGMCPKAIRNYFDSVRACVTDCGTEWSVVDMPDYVDEYLNGMPADNPEADIGARGHLMKNAIRLPGWSHSHDWCLKRTLTALPWWSEFLEDARLMCWFLNYQQYREIVARRARRELDWDEMWERSMGNFRANFDV